MTTFTWKRSGSISPKTRSDIYLRMTKNHVSGKAETNERRLKWCFVLQQHVCDLQTTETCCLMEKSACGLSLILFLPREVLKIAQKACWNWSRRMLTEKPTNTCFYSTSFPRFSRSGRSEHHGTSKCNISTLRLMWQRMTQILRQLATEVSEYASIWKRSLQTAQILRFWT